MKMSLFDRQLFPRQREGKGKKRKKKKDAE
jgi:hypothetical protein